MSGNWKKGFIHCLPLQIGKMLLELAQNLQMDILVSNFFFFFALLVYLWRLSGFLFQWVLERDFRERYNCKGGGQSKL